MIPILYANKSYFLNKKVEKCDIINIYEREVLIMSIKDVSKKMKSNKVLSTILIISIFAIIIFTGIEVVTSNKKQSSLIKDSNKIISEKNKDEEGNIELLDKEKESLSGLETSTSMKNYHGQTNKNTDLKPNNPSKDVEDSKKALDKVVEQAKKNEMKPAVEAIVKEKEKETKVTPKLTSKVIQKVTPKVTPTQTKVTNVDVAGLDKLPSKYDISVNPSHEQIILKLLNEKRRQAGLGELTMDNTLVKVARYKSNHMIQYGYFNHPTPQGILWYDWLKKIGYSYTATAENIAYNYLGPEELFNQWWKSPGHKKNMMEPSYKKIGIGVVYNKAKNQYMGT